MTSRLVNIPKTLFLFLLALLGVAYIHAFLVLDDISHLGISVLYFLAVARLVKDKWQNFNLQTSLISGLVGVLLFIGLAVGAVVFRPADGSVIFSAVDVFWRMMPLVAGVALACLASSSHIVFFWRELVILLFLGAPRLIFSALYDPSPLTAKGAWFVLYYLGFDVRIIDEITVLLPTGGITVWEACSGLETICYTLGLSIILILMYPTANRWIQASVPLMAIVIGFVVNLIRVVLLALLNAWGYKEAFVYWHERNGSLVFGLIAVMTLGLFHYFLPQPVES